MQIVCHWIDPNPSLQTGVRPIFGFRRDLCHGNKSSGGLFNTAKVAGTAEHWIPQTSVLVDPVQWVVCKSGDVVLVPVSAYRSTTRFAPSLFAAGLEIGIAAVTKLRQHTNDVPLAVHLVLGNPCTDLGPTGVDAYRCYVGIAIQTKE